MRSFGLPGAIMRTAPTIEICSTSAGGGIHEPIGNSIFWNTHFGRMHNAGSNGS